MPVLGVTDRKSVAQIGRFTEIGKLKKGERHGSQLTDLDYFRFMPSPGFEGIERAFAACYGDNPRAIFGYLPFNTVERNWGTWGEKWGDKAGLLHRCNGVYMTRWLDPATKQYVNDRDCTTKTPCPFGSEGNGQDGWSDTPCKLVGRLSLILPQLMEELVTNADEYGIDVAPLGFVTVETHSTHDLSTLSRELYSLEAEGGANGLHYMPVILRRVYEEVGVSFEGKSGDTVKTKAKKWMLHIATTNDYLLERIAASDKRRQIEAKTGLLPSEAGGMDPEDDGSAVEGELVEPAVVSGPAEVEPESDGDQVQARAKLDNALKYQTTSGKVLGELGPNELEEMLDKINGLNNPNALMLQLKGHLETLIDFLQTPQQTEAKEEAV